MRMGIFGGTFDPVHLGHLRAAQEAADKLELDRVLFIPAGCPPHRRAPQASAAHRLAMVKRAVADNPLFEVSDMEIRRAGKSYTVDTLAELARSAPFNELFLIVGIDQIAKLDKWRQPHKISEYARLVVISRPGVKISAVKRKPASPVFRSWSKEPIFLQVSLLDISASNIRKLLRTGREVRYLVPEPVIRYLRSHNLYYK